MNRCPNCKCDLKKHEKEIIQNALTDELKERIKAIEASRLKSIKKMNERNA